MNKKIWLFFFSLGLLLLLEGLTRIYSNALYNESPTQWLLRSNLNSALIQPVADSHHFVLSTNKDGLRTQLPIQSQRSVRIALLGDSNVLGWGVDDNNDIASILNQKNSLKEHDVEILNAGQPGHSTAQSKRVLCEILPNYRPTHALLFLSMHDHNQSSLSDLEKTGVGLTATSQVRSFLVNHVALYRNLRNAIYPPQKNPADQKGETFRVTNAERAFLLKEMQTCLSTWNGQLWLGLLPFFEDLSSSPLSPPIARKGVDWAKNWSLINQAAFLDLRTCCGPQGQTLVFPFDKGHLNSKGLNLVADALWKEIESELFSP